MKPKVSIVWKFFKKSPDTKTVTCSLCKKTLRFYGNTSNLKQHIIRIHPVQFRQEEGITNQNNANTLQSSSVSDTLEPLPGPSTSNILQTNTSKVPTNTTVKSNSCFRQLRLRKVNNELTKTEKDAIDKCIMKMIATDYQPLSFVENPGFLEYTRILHEIYLPPSRKTLSTVLLPQFYAEAQTKIRSVLNFIENVAVTTDIWTSDSNQAYITVTCHFIHNKLISIVLATREMSEAHTGANIATTLLSIFQEWQIENKIVTIVSDNGANIKNAINEHLNMYHHPCVAHTLNLCVNDAIQGNKQFSSLLKKCRSLVAHFKHSVSAAEKLKQTQISMGYPILKVKQHVATRWNSALIMIERLQQIKSSLSVAIADLPQAPESLNASNWEVLADCIKILKPLETMTKELSGEKYPTMSLVVPLIRGLQQKIKDLLPQTEVGVNLQHDLIETISKRLGQLETNKIVAKATFIDPRLKKLAFGLEENGRNAQKWIADEVTNIINNNRGSITSYVTESSSTPKDDQNSLWTYFEEQVAQVQPTVTASTTGTLLVRQYMELPHLMRQNDPLEFWKIHKNTLSELYQLHLKYSCIPATSVPSERVFSKAGQLTNMRRNRLLPKNLDQIIFLNSFFSAELN